MSELTAMFGISRSTLFRTVQRLSVQVALVTPPRVPYPQAAAVGRRGGGEGHPASRVTTGRVGGEGGQGDVGGAGGGRGGGGDGADC